MGNGFASGEGRVSRDSVCARTRALCEGRSRGVMLRTTRLMSWTPFGMSAAVMVDLVVGGVA